MTTFLDSNVLLYTEDADAPLKREIALRHVRAAFADPGGVISTQVLQEFYVNAVRKLAMTKPAARERVLAFAKLNVVPVTTDLIASAMEMHQLHAISFWDALIVRTAAAAGCTTLLSEDLQDGASYEGVRIVNPFSSVAGR
jgi:predicted nucleic acid-binding protein